MRTWFLGVLAVVLACGVPALAGTPQASPLLGRWAVDVDRLPMPPEARPQRVTFAFGEAEAGRWTIRVEIVQADGQARVSHAAVAMDGSTVPIEGDQLEADAVAARQPAPGVLVLALAKAGVPASTRVYAVAPDGEHLVETAVYFDADGKAVMRSFHAARMR